MTLRIPVQQMSNLDVVYYLRWCRCCCCCCCCFFCFTCLKLSFPSQNGLLVELVSVSGGRITIVEAFPDTTVGEFKAELKGMQEFQDDLMKKMTSVEVVVSEGKLVDNDATVVQAGLSQDVVVQVCFTVIKICSSGVWFTFHCSSLVYIYNTLYIIDSIIIDIFILC